MKKISTECYAGTKTNIQLLDKNVDFKVNGAIRELAVIPWMVEYDPKIEAQAYNCLIKKYSKKIARSYAYFCAMVLGYTLYDGMTLNWAMQQAESRIRV